MHPSNFAHWSLSTARDLTIEAARDASYARKTTRPLPSAQLKKLLDSRSEREVLEGLRRVVTVRWSCYRILLASWWHQDFLGHIVLTVLQDVVSTTALPDSSLFYTRHQEYRVALATDQEACLYIPPAACRA